MKKILLYSALLLAGLLLSQFLPAAAPEFHRAIALPLKLLTMFCLAFIMIHVGLEFEIDKSRLREYGWDYVVAGTAAAFPWVFCALYFIFVLHPQPQWWDADTWKQSFLLGRFSAPTSAGILFSMLAAAGLGATWVFRKARILAIFDDLDTVLLLIPLKMLMVGLQWQFGFVLAVMGVQLWLGWKYLRRSALPVSWPWLLLYSGVIVAACEAIYLSSKLVNELVPVHIEVLLPAFVLGCLLAHPRPDHPVDRERSEESGHAADDNVSGFISAAFMLLVGLSMPLVAGGSPGAIAGDSASPGSGWPGWGTIALHVGFVTVVSNLGKMFPVFCYRKEAALRERLAVAVAMFPRGEVGAGVLVVSLSYGIGGPMVTVAMLSLALNLLLTGLFIAFVKSLLREKA